MTFGEKEGLKTRSQTTFDPFFYNVYVMYVIQ
jgi:hypothetical protein